MCLVSPAERRLSGAPRASLHGRAIAAVLDDDFATALAVEDPISGLQRYPRFSLRRSRTAAFGNPHATAHDEDVTTRANEFRFHVPNPPQFII